MAIPSGYSLLGRIGYNDRGVYTESSDYVRGDVVYHEGSSYVALTTVTGVTPADDNTNWKYLARGFGATELSEIDATDTSGFAGDAGKKVKGQTLIDKIAEYMMSKVVATDSFQTYLQKFLVDNCVTERSDLSLSAAQGKVLQDQLATLNSNLEWKYVADVIGSSTINIPSDACEIFVTVTKSSVIYDGVTTLSLLVPVRILSTVYQDFLNGGYGNNDQQTYLAFFRINKYNAHLYALKVAGQDYTATSQLKMWYR